MSVNDLVIAYRAGGDDHAVMPNQIRKLRDDRGWTLAELAERLETSPQQVHKLEKGERKLTVEWLTRLRDAFGLRDIADVVAPRTGERAEEAFTSSNGSAEIERIDVTLRPIWIKGEVQAGAWFESAEWPREQWEPAIGVDRANFPYRDMFAVRVRGRSMDQVFPPGTVLICVGAAFDREVPRHGDYVIVHRRGKGGDLWESTVKYLEVDGDGRMRLWARSTLPEFADPIEPTADGEDDVQIVGIVLDSLVRHRR